MIYRNTKTGAIIDSSCAISGGDWVPEEPAKIVAAPAIVEEPKMKPDEPEEEIRLSELTVQQLKELAEELEIDLGKATKKDDIIAVILAAEENSEE